MATAYDTANIIIPKGGGYKAGSLYGWNPQDSSLVDFSVARAGATATRVNSSGLIESVAANTPRWDWAEGGSCPSLLIEPQRTNLALRSEELDNGVYALVNATITADSTTSPDGTTTADTLTDDATTGQHRITQEIAVTSGTEYTFSVFVKNNNIDYCYLLFENAFTQTRFFFNISTGTAITAGGSIVDYGNGWYRLSASLSATSTANGRFGLNMSDNGVNATYSGSGSSLFAFGFQVETGGYASSYIPTAGTTETRNADVITKTSIASLLGQSEGTLYAEIKALAADSTAKSISINDGSVSNTARVRFTSGNEIEGSNLVGGSTQSAIATSGATITNYNKLAFSYSVNNFGFSVNGSQIGDDTNGSTYTGTTLNQLSFTRGGSGEPFYGRIRTLSAYGYAMTETERNNITT